MLDPSQIRQQARELGTSGYRIIEAMDGNGDDVHVTFKRWCKGLEEELLGIDTNRVTVRVLRNYANELAVVLEAAA